MPTHGHPSWRLRGMLVPCLLLAGCGGSGGPIDGRAALQHAEKIVAFGPRPPASAALAQARGYIEERVKELGLEAQEDAFTEPKEKGLRFVNVWTEIAGLDPAHGPILLIGAHYDSKLTEGHPDPKHNFQFVGAVDSAGACGVLLELARVLKERKNVPNIWLVWFDGEESLDFDWGTGERALFGSKHFVAAMSADQQRFPKGLSARMKAMVLLDMVGAKDFKIDRDTTSDPDLLQIFTHAAERLGEGKRMYIYESKMTDDHVAFRNHGVAVIDLIDLAQRAPEQAPRDGSKPEYQTYWHAAQDTLDKLSPEGLAFAGNLVWQALPDIETTFYKKP